MLASRLKAQLMFQESFDNSKLTLEMVIGLVAQVFGI